jgi:hypothetical protein
VDQKKSELIPVPLPTEIPEPPSMDQIPLDILHSATVEMLIQQNDDLSSRLKVNIRRNSQQEQKLLELKKEIDTLQRKNENLLAQNEIVKEKEHIWTRQKEAQNRKVESSQKEMELLQLRYNELYTTSKQRQKELYKQITDKNKIIESLQRKLHIFKKVRIKAKDRLRNFLLQAAQSIHQGQSVTTQTMSQNRILKKQFESLSLEITQKEEIFRKHLDDIKNLSQKRIHELEQSVTELQQSIELKDKKYQDLKVEADQLLDDFRVEQKGRAKIAALAREIGELKNENLREKRKYIEIIKKLEQSRSSEAQTLSSSKEENQRLEQLIREQKESLSRCEETILALNKDNNEIESQLENLQTLWMDAQNSLEKEQLKRQTLEKINRELSKKKNDDRVTQSIERSNASDTAPKTQNSNKNSLNNKLTEVYASQYSSIPKQPEL